MSNVKTVWKLVYLATIQSALARFRFYSTHSNHGIAHRHRRGGATLTQRPAMIGGCVRPILSHAVRGYDGDALTAPDAELSAAAAAGATYLR